MIDHRGYYLKSDAEFDAVLSLNLGKENPRELLGQEDIAKALRIHRSDPNDGRHHAYDVDVRTLLGYDWFRKALREKAAALPRPDVMLVPHHESGEKIARLLQEDNHARIVVANRLKPVDSLPTEDQSLLAAAKNILIVDDVVNSGSRLAGYLDGIRTHFSQTDQLNILVGICRTESNELLRRIRKTLRSPKWSIQFDFVAHFILPAWNAKNCPWCRELRFLAQVMQRLADPPEWLTNRVSGLRVSVPVQKYP